MMEKMLRFQRIKTIIITVVILSYFMHTQRVKWSLEFYTNEDSNGII